VGLAIVETGSADQTTVGLNIRPATVHSIADVGCAIEIVRAQSVFIRYPVTVIVLTITWIQGFHDVPGARTPRLKPVTEYPLRLTRRSKKKNESRKQRELPFHSSPPDPIAQLSISMVYDLLTKTIP